MSMRAKSSDTCENLFREPHFGVNLAGAEFGGHNLPGVYGRHYVYPGDESLDYYASRGRSLIRLPFRWERIQRELHRPLHAQEAIRIHAFLQLAAVRGLRVILNLHNYGRYHFAGDSPNDHPIIGSERVPVSALADLWSKLATEFAGEPAVCAYGLMNETHDMGDENRWPLAAQAAIDAIRRVDTATPIMVAGDNWSSSRTWPAGANEALHEKVHDPNDNLVFEAHCYFDKDNSGSYARSYDAEGGSPDCGVEYVRPFVEWCHENCVRGFIGEYGVPDNDPRWLETMERFLAYLQDNGMSSTYWAGGPWWENYPLSIEPAVARNTQPGAPPAPDRPQMLILSRFPG